MCYLLRFDSWFYHFIDRDGHFHLTLTGSYWTISAL